MTQKGEAKTQYLPFDLDGAYLDILCSLRLSYAKLIFHYV